MSGHTFGTWRWEVNPRCRTVALVNERGYYVMEFARWGLQGAQPVFPSTCDGLVIMRKLSERDDWVAPFEGQEHHSHWHATIDHANARLIAAAPDLLDALVNSLPYVTDAEGFPEQFKPGVVAKDVAKIRAAIAKATGEPA